MLFWCAVLVHEDLPNPTLLRAFWIFKTWLLMCIFMKQYILWFKNRKENMSIEFHMYLNNKWWFKLSDCFWTLRFFYVIFYLQALIKSFLPNLRSTSAVTRRTAASCLVLICEHSRSSASFYNYLLGSLLGEQLYWGI